MATLEEVEALRSANAELSTLVKAELAAAFESLDLSSPELARDVMLEYLPVLVSTFGDVSAAAAMEWYEQVRDTAGKRSVRALAAPGGIPVEAIEAKVRYSASHLWTPAPEKTLSSLQDAADKYVKQPGRDTISYNATRNGSRWMRVPTGLRTCSWCLMLASRSGAWLYRSRSTALFDHKTGEPYHGGTCDCTVVEVDSEDDLPNADEIREMYAMYSISADAVDPDGRNDTKAILYDMRRRFSDVLSDGVVDDDYLSHMG